MQTCSSIMISAIAAHVQEVRIHKQTCGESLVQIQLTTSGMGIHRSVRHPAEECGRLRRGAAGRVLVGEEAVTEPGILAGFFYDACSRGRVLDSEACQPLVLHYNAHSRWRLCT